MHMVIMKNNQRPLRLEMDLAKELEEKGPLSRNGLKVIFLNKTYNKTKE